MESVSLKNKKFSRGDILKIVLDELRFIIPQVFDITKSTPFLLPLGTYLPTYF